MFRTKPGSNANPRVFSLLLLATLLLAPAVAARGARPRGPELLPERTLAFVQIADVPQFVEQFRQTSMGRIGSDEKIQPLVRDLYGSAAAAFEELEDRVGVSLDELLRVPQGELWVAMVAPETGRPQVVGLIDVGDQLPAAKKLLERLAAQVVDQGGGRTVEDVDGVQLDVYRFGGDERRLAVFEKDQTIVLASDADLAKQMLAAWDGAGDFKTLADNPRFRTIMQRCKAPDEGSAQAVFFVEPFTLAQRLNRGNLSAQATLATFAGLGLDGVEAVGGSYAVATEQFDAMMQVHVLLDSPRQGVLAALAMEDGDTAPEPWVPADIVSYTTINWDIAKTLAEASRLFDVFRGEGAWQTEMVDRMSDRLQLDFQADMLDQIAGRGTLVAWIERPAKLNAQANLFGIKLKDAEAFQKTAAGLAERFPNALTEDRYANLTYYKITSRRRNRNRPQDERIARVPDPCFAVVGDYLLVTDSSKLLQEAIVTKQRSGESLAEDLEFKLIAAEIRRQTKGAKAGMISFHRPEESLRALYELGTSRDIRDRLAENAPNNRGLKALYDALERNPLPPFSVIARYLAPGGSILTSDATGFHYTTFTLRREPAQ